MADATLQFGDGDGSHCSVCGRQCDVRALTHDMDPITGRAGCGSRFVRMINATGDPAWDEQCRRLRPDLPFQATGSAFG